MGSHCSGYSSVTVKFFTFTRIPSYISNKSPTRCKNFPVHHSDVHLQLNMFRASSRPSSGAHQLQQQPLVLPSYRCDSRTFVCSRAGRPAGSTTNNRGCKYSLELLMMSGMPLETCWAFYKFWNKEFYYKDAYWWLFLLIHKHLFGKPEWEETTWKILLILFYNVRLNYQGHASYGVLVTF
jgi:hypothetical protein